MTIEARYDLVLLFDCHMGNPNGDPDAGNSPRVDPETMHGLVSDVAQKRRVRDWVYLTQVDDKGNPREGYDIFFGHSGLPERQVLNRQIEGAHESLLTPEQKEQLKALTGDKRKKLTDELSKKNSGSARNYLCRTRYDVRTFGAVLSTGDLKAGQLRGPVQCTFARSIEPISPMEVAITRKSVTTEEDAAKQMDKDGSITGTIGRKSLIPYGLYQSYWFVSPMLARQTGFSKEDFRLLCEALLAMWEADRSSSKGMMATQALWVFAHTSALGNARAHELFRRVRVERATEGAARSIADYRLSVDREALPEGVQVYNLADRGDFERLFGGT